MPNGPHRITGLPFEEELFSSEHSVKDADIQVRLLFCILNNRLIQANNFQNVFFYIFIKKIKQKSYITQINGLITSTGMTNFAHFYEDRPKLKIPFEIQTSLHPPYIQFKKCMKYILLFSSITPKNYIVI